ncbi:probable C-mannosyltransferase DPY19L1 isoform X2 [Copidosoma floridanum]|nr:probable C-mannosyltransferase DPY19L1 isoform X2 [Copidosoma floridanum]
MQKVHHDNLSEYPNVINAESKYSLGPEVNIGMFYHIMKFFGLLPKPQCWQIERGHGLAPITSCEGIGVPVYFYLEFVWLCALVTGYTIFLFGANLSGSVIGGLIAVASFFFNHTECTRVQWTPPLRESFAYPALLLQMFLLSEILKKKKKPETTSTYVDLTVLSGFCLQSWQFSQFVFVTQTIAMLILKWLRIIDVSMYRFFITIHLLAVGLVFAVTGNSFLMNSIHLALLIVSCFTSELSHFLSSRHYDPKTMTLLEIACTLVFSKLFKIALSSNSDDEHIFNILRSKISSYKDFHTLLYTCAPEFDFLKYENYEAIVKTFLLPTAILAGFLILYYWYRNLRSQGFPGCIEPHVAYNMLQMGAFVIMAVFVMRLKLFMTPHLCILAGQVSSKRYLEKLGIKKKTTQGALIALILALMSYHGFQRVLKERDFVGEYSNVDQEEVLEWIQTSTPKTASFAGQMSLMANIMLSTKRPVVNNPYYESKEMHEKTMKVYEIFSRKSVAEVHETLMKLHVDYLVIEEGLCYGYGYWKPGCKMLELWDFVDRGKAKNEGQVPVCPTLFHGNAHPFHRVFENRSYVVLQLNYTKFIELKPKTIMYSQ